MATVTRQAVREYLLDSYNIGRRGTNTGTSASAITDDADFGGHAAAENIDVGCEALITSGNRDGQLARLSSRPALTTGAMNLDPPLSGVLANTDTFEILYRPFRFKEVHDAINKAATKTLYEKLELPITLVPDGDMLSSGTSDWAEVGSGTMVKVAASFPYAQRSLRLTAGATDDYIRTASIAVEQNTGYYLEVTGAIGPSGAAADIGTLILVDVTNSNASITLTESSITRFEPDILANNVTMPSGCEQVQIWLRSEENGDIIEWSNVIFRRTDARQFTIQDRAEIDRLGNLFVYGTNDWGTRGLNRAKLGHGLEPRTAGLWVYRTYGSVSGSLWYEEFRKPSSLDSDTDATFIPKEDLAPIAAEILLKPYRNEERWTNLYLLALQDAEEVKRRYRKLRSVVDRSVRNIAQPVF